MQAATRLFVLLRLPQGRLFEAKSRLLLCLQVLAGSVNP